MDGWMDGWIEMLNGVVAVSHTNLVVFPVFFRLPSLLLLPF
jgi:hypothetical protein